MVRKRTQTFPKASLFFFTRIIGHTSNFSCKKYSSIVYNISMLNADFWKHLIQRHIAFAKSCKMNGNTPNLKGMTVKWMIVALILQVFLPLDINTAVRSEVFITSLLVFDLVQDLFFSPKKAASKILWSPENVRTYYFKRAISIFLVVKRHSKWANLRVGNQRQIHETHCYL